MSRAMVAPYLCAVVNALAALALATILAPGVSLVPTAAQATYAADHLPAWRLGWGLWIAAALSLVAFFGWWASRIAWPPVARAAVVIAVAGVLADMIAEGRLIAWSPGQRFDIDGALRLSGIGANGFTRPMCPYPQYAEYKGTGGLKDAANWSCKAPAPGTRAN